MAEGVDPVYTARFRRKYGGEDGLRRYVAVLYDLLADTLGADKMVLRAGKLNALKLMRSNLVPERILALQRLVFEDPTLERAPGGGKVSRSDRRDRRRAGRPDCAEKRGRRYRA